MCVMSMIMDHYQDKWTDRLGDTMPLPGWPMISKEEIEEFRQLLERAREYDRRTGQPDCELDSKRQALLNLAKELGVEIKFL